MKNFNGKEDSFPTFDLAAVEGQLEQLQAHVDQRFDELTGMIDDLDSRINNLR